jgi:hypothetical protein
MDLFAVVYDDSIEWESRTPVTVSKETLLQEMKKEGKVLFAPRERYICEGTFCLFYWNGRSTHLSPQGFLVEFADKEGVSKKLHYDFRRSETWEKCNEITKQIDMWLREIKEECLSDKE